MFVQAGDNAYQAKWEQKGTTAIINRNAVTGEGGYYNFFSP